MRNLIKFESHARIAIITIDRPDELNALSEAALRELQLIVQRIQQSTEVRAVILKGEGKSFCAGGDIGFFYQVVKMEPALRPAEVRAYVGLAHEVIAQLAALEVPLIVCAQGPVAGFGLSLCCLADVLIADENTKFVPAYIGLGATPDGGLSHNLPVLIGERKALQLLLTNQVFGAFDAEKWGLVSGVVESSKLMDSAIQYAEKIVNGPLKAIINTRQLIKKDRLSELKNQLELELESFAECVMTADFVEGVMAFVEKRKPEFV
ncbi:enoyl-CoA hydratase/isomerase family protein [Marinobacterium rhizophilum]|uniref:Enoyl-CoA hydratase/isomerase family protein n=1 Tax=Marinobacterium rhizophilum TaxID=420402 RepID=A0ABY5HJP5_9GAMM|nr:enoyl-CoA hydratase-related protein [Marinobacterium rhizophilum]UTW12339.1 enoyl-CoA hydratase/isomerase family protein [Marinobacterium rhizophilum]